MKPMRRRGKEDYQEWEYEEENWKKKQEEEEEALDFSHHRLEIKLELFLLSKCLDLCI